MDDEPGGAAGGIGGDRRDPDRPAGGPREGSGDPSTGLPWERRAVLGFWPATGATLRQVLFSPSSAFASMHRTGGFSEPLLFLALFGSIGAWFALLWQMLARSLGVDLTATGAAEIAFQNTVTVVFAALTPVMVVAGMVVWAIIVHLLLLLFGGAPHPFETTLRVLAYVGGATAVFQVVPLCGGLISFLWGVVLQIVGLAVAQEVPTGRSAAAVLVPMLLACACFAVAIFFSVGFMVAAMQGFS